MADQDAPTTEQAAEPIELSTPIESRFLFVDIAAMRAKQLRRGARPRLGPAPEDDPAAFKMSQPHKLERVAMEEVRQRLVQYTLPEAPVAKA